MAAKEGSPVGVLVGECFLPTERIHKGGHRHRVEACLGRELLTESVCFSFLITTVGRQCKRTGKLPDSADHLPNLRRHDARGGSAESGDNLNWDQGRLGGLAADRVSRSDVPDFMSNDIGQLVLTVHISEQAPRYVDVPTWKRKGIGFCHGDDQEFVVKLGPGGLSGETLTQLIHVGLQSRVIECPHLFFDFTRRFPALFDFPFFSGEDSFRATRHRVPCTATAKTHDSEQNAGEGSRSQARKTLTAEGLASPFGKHTSPHGGQRAEPAGAEWDIVLGLADKAHGSHLFCPSPGRAADLERTGREPWTRLSSHGSQGTFERRQINEEWTFEPT